MRRACCPPCVSTVVWLGGKVVVCLLSAAHTGLHARAVVVSVDDSVARRHGRSNHTMVADLWKVLQSTVRDISVRVFGLLLRAIVVWTDYLFPWLRDGISILVVSFSSASIV